MQAYKGKTCVVTGAASGIGRAITAALAKNGAKLAICDINADGLSETVERVGGSNRIMSDVFDMADAQAIADYAVKVETTLGPADYVFNVAGLSRVGTFLDTPLESMEKVMDVNYWGVVRMSKAFINQIIAQKGTLVNISSLFGLIAHAGQTHYCASKFAVRGFTETLAQELDGKDVGICCVHPGGIATNIARNSVVDKLPATGLTKDEMNTEFDRLAITSADKAAEVILNGALKRQRRIVVGKDAKIASFIQRLFPVKYPNILAKYTGDKIAMKTQ